MKRRSFLALSLAAIAEQSMAQGIGVSHGTGGSGALATFDPANSGPLVALSNSNLTATATSGAGGEKIARSTLARSSGKPHIEFRALSDLVSETAAFGICTSAFVFSGASFLGQDLESVGIWPRTVGCNIWQNNVASGLTGGIGAAANDWFALEIDFGAKLLWVKNITQASAWNKNQFGAADPAAGTGGYDYSAIHAGALYFAVDMESNAQGWTVNAGQSTYQLTPSTGYSTW